LYSIYCIEDTQTHTTHLQQDKSNDTPTKANQFSLAPIVMRK
jgi:hypothetical protein